MKRPERERRTLPPDTSTPESVQLDVVEIGARIKRARAALGLTQDALAVLAGSPSKRGIQENESGNTMPGGQIIGTLVCAGVNANWLLTGEGSMLLAELQAATPTAPFETARLQLALEAVEEGLAATSRTMPPDKKAELILAVYDLLDDVDATSKGKILRLVKLAA
ncbi:transcriptional regulator [Andreprevotia chitinilytica]|uniref:transcriptional regulator n=1 Tax=Andreprevotia chitinilytica TaxID=396808 RepID=UPI00068E9F32|nr:transcriptional regulator [Andreprevotia chitinilytica]